MLMLFIKYTPLALLFPIVMAIIRRKYLKNELKVIPYFLGAMVVAEIYGRVLVIVLKKNNLPGLHVYTVFEFLLIALFYHLFLNGFISKKIIPSLIIFFTVFAIINAVFIQTIYEFNTYPRAIESLVIVCLGILAFYKMFQTQEYERIDQTPVFWIVSGITLFFSGNLFLFVLGNLLLSKDVELSKLAWGINASLGIFMNIFIAIGLWWSRREQ